MNFKLDIPDEKKGTIPLTLEVGRCLFVVGRTGSGKSGLLQKLFKDHSSAARWIPAYRQIWFVSGLVSITPGQKDNLEKTIAGYSKNNEEARWRDYSPFDRVQIPIFDLAAAENSRARSIAKAVDDNDPERLEQLKQTPSPIQQINELFHLSNIPISLNMPKDGEFQAVRSQGEAYGIEQLSDGERNALLIAATVLTAPGATLILIDEPERHLHRSIASAFLTQLLQQRPDCAFIISTHDLMLPLDNPSSHVLILRNCRFQGNAIHSWEAHLYPSSTSIDESLKKDILGSRQTILFVEGTEQSLDKALYGLLFPNVTVIPKGGCRDVQHAVQAIRSCRDLHWLQVYGLIDNDYRPPDECTKLLQQGIVTTPYYSVESIYYHSEILKKIAERQAKVDGRDAGGKLESAKREVLQKVSYENHKEHLVNRIVEKRVRAQFNSSSPTKEQLASTKPITISIDVPRIRQDEDEKLKLFIDNNSWEEILARYPVRETPALDAIAKALGFQNRAHYEEAVLTLLKEDHQLIDCVRKEFGLLFQETVHSAEALSLQPVKQLN
ncbi:MAG: DUF4435 domain-containing protein [Nitrospirae bacterium]|nr:MAG: DUF4435 domain-containing protein [Nitrospirota bacterium]